MPCKIELKHMVIGFLCLIIMEELFRINVVMKLMLQETTTAKENATGQRRIWSGYKISSLEIHPDGNYSEQGSVTQKSQSEVDQVTLPPAVSARVLQLQTGCQKLHDEGLTPDRIVNSKLNHLIVNDKHKVLYCFVPKVACTNLKRVFLLLTGKMNETEPLKLKANDVHTIHTKYFHFLHQDSEEDIRFKIKHYRKIVFVREPLERLLSAYRNKFIQVQEGGFYFKEQFGKQIIKRYRVNASAESLRRGHDVKFNEFVQYLLDTPVKSFNEHWASISSLCFPCHIAYDFIGKYETLNDDVALLLKEMSLDDHISFPKRNESYNYEPTEDIMMEYFRRIPRQSLNPLWKIYHQDCILFGYQFPSIIKKLLDVPQPT